MSFADVEARVNASASGRLANATATVILPATAAGLTVDGIFDATDLAVDLGPGLESSSPQFAANEADLPDALADALAAGDEAKLSIRGIDYAVIEPKPDGTGWTTLRLRR